MGHEREVHTHRILAASVRMEEFTSHIGNSRIKRSIIKLDRIKALRNSQEQEKSAFRMSPSYALRHMLFQKSQKQVTLSLI